MSHESADKWWQTHAYTAVSISSLPTDTGNWRHFYQLYISDPICSWSKICKPPCLIPSPLRGPELLTRRYCLISLKGDSLFGPCIAGLASVVSSCSAIAANWLSTKYKLFSKWRDESRKLFSASCTTVCLFLDSAKQSCRYEFLLIQDWNLVLFLCEIARPRVGTYW